MTASLEAMLATGDIGAHALLTQSQQAARVALELRARVKPGARVLLAQHPERSVWSKLSGLLSSRVDELDAADLLARGMLLAGLEEPRVVIHTPELVAVTARVPAHPDALDQVFGGVHE